jgi:hypothetical protein
MRGKKKTKNINVRDIKPKKDAKGGLLISRPQHGDSPVSPKGVDGGGGGHSINRIYGP